MNLFCCSSIKDFHKIQALLLQIQGVFKEKIIFKDLAVFQGVFQASANHVQQQHVASNHELTHMGGDRRASNLSPEVNRRSTECLISINVTPVTPSSYMLSLSSCIDCKVKT